MLMLYHDHNSSFSGSFDSWLQAEKKKEAFDEDALDFEPEEEGETEVSIPVREVSWMVADLLDASDDGENVKD